MDKKTIGFIGESIAEMYLHERGSKIIERNFHIRGGEIDLIVLDEKNLVCVEVKTRTQPHFGTGVESITRNKKRILRRALHTYVEKLSLQNSSKNPSQIIFDSLRFDVISLELELSTRRVKKLTHIKNIDMS